MALEQKQLQRLIHLLGMMGSDHDGEILAAALAAQRLVKGAGETWESILAPLSRDEQRSWASSSRPEPERRSYKKTEPVYFEEVRACLERKNLLSQWERDFLESLLTRDWPNLTEKQRAIVDRVKEKLATYADMHW
jgi:hypothetical protein